MFHVEVLFAVTIGTLPSLIQSACMAIKQEMPIGKPVTLDCLYDGNKRIPYGETHLDMDKCMECTCPLSGPLQCCTMNHPPHLVQVEGCVAKQIHCQTVLVDANDESQPCPYYAEDSTSDSTSTYTNELTDTSNSIGPNAATETTNSIGPYGVGYRFGGNGALSLSADEYSLLMEIALGFMMQRQFPN